MTSIDITSKTHKTNRAKKKHENDTSGDTSKDTDKDTGKMSCELCKKSFSFRGGLTKHLRDQHAVDTTKMRLDQNKFCECFHEECRLKGVRLRSSADYRLHLEDCHGVQGATSVTQLVFDTFEEVQTWKAEQERQDVSKFVQFCSVIRTKTTLTWRYRCNRSGSYASQSSGKRRGKRQGSCKSGYKCPADIIVVLREGRHFVSYHSMHYGHEKLLCHLSLNVKDRQRIAGQLAQGIAMEKILQDVRQSVNSDFNRSHLITRKDLNNIRQAYGLKDRDVSSLHDAQQAAEIEIDNCLGIQDWIEEMEKLGSDSPVLLCKKIGEEMHGIDPDDFLIVLMSPLQRKMLQKFGRERICCDSTHGMSGHEFELTTVLVVDDYDEGFPVAFMYSTSASSGNLLLFFNCIKNAVGVISTACFICDDVLMLYDAWLAIMGPVAKKVSYTQHVDIKSRDNGTKSDGSVTICDSRQAIQKGLRLCYVELRNIKLLRMENNGSTKKIDKHIDALYTFVLDKQFNRLTKLHKGKLSAKLASMMQSHTEGMALAITCLQLDRLHWQVQSASVAYRIYLVQKSDVHNCTEDCTVVCRQCQACLSAMSCTCDDYQMHGNMCKHIHAAATTQLAVNVPVQPWPDQVLSHEARDEMKFYLSTLRTKCRPHKEETIRTYIQEITELAVDEHYIEKTVLSDILTYLKTIKQLLIKDRDNRFADKCQGEKYVLNTPVVHGQVNKLRTILPKTDDVCAEEVCLETVAKRTKSNKHKIREMGVMDANIGMFGDTLVSTNNLITQAKPTEGNITFSDLGINVSQSIGSASQSGSSQGGAMQQNSINGDQITARHMETATGILRKQFPLVVGLESPQLSPFGQGFTSQATNSCLTVQVHNTGSGHWVTSTRGPGEDFVTIYDSLLTVGSLAKTQLRPSLQIQISQIYYCLAKEIRVLLPEMSHPVNSLDSGLYTIAAAVDICFGNRPSERDYDKTQLRPHVLKCLQKQCFEPFPGVCTSRNSVFLASIPVYCVCRSAASDKMMKCWQCFESFHSKCVQCSSGPFCCAACCSLGLSEQRIEAGDPGAQKDDCTFQCVP